MFVRLDIHPSSLRKIPFHFRLTCVLYEFVHGDLAVSNESTVIEILSIK